MAAASDAGDGAVGKNDFEAHHVVFGDAVFEATRASGIGGDVAAQGAFLEGGWVGGVIPAC